MKHLRKPDNPNSEESGDCESEQGDSKYDKSAGEEPDIDDPLSTNIKLRLRNTLSYRLRP